MTLRLPCFRLIIGLAGLVLWLALSTPAPAGSLILDPPSPSWPVTEDILNDWPGVGPGPVSIGLNRSMLGLAIGDVIDAISLGNDPLHVPVHGVHDHIFSVTRGSLGGGGTGVEGERLVDTGTGPSPGHAADLFLWEVSAIGTNRLAPRGLGWRGGAQTGDEENTGLVNFGPRDDVSGFEFTTMSWGAPTHPPYEVYFSLAPGSPTLGVLGVGAGAILGIGGVFPGPLPSVYKTSADLGIPLFADMDALSLEVDPAPPGHPILVDIHFSVTAATATGWPYGADIVTSGADILVPGGVGWVPATHGLLPTDDIDALETVLPCTPCPGDLDGDGVIGIGDLLIVLSRWGLCP
jgi:hypothetical protein